jgi:hypothetical protein
MSCTRPKIFGSDGHYWTKKYVVAAKINSGKWVFFNNIYIRKDWFLLQYQVTTDIIDAEEYFMRKLEGEL